MLTFSGSVGLDQTLQYSAALPLTAKLVHRDTLPPALQNQTITVAITGTVKEPRFDEKAFLMAAAEFGLKAAGNTLLDKVMKQGTPPPGTTTPPATAPATPPGTTQPPPAKSGKDAAIEEGMKILGDFLKKPKSSP